MFRFPNIKPARIASVDQFCSHCNQWFSFPKADVKKLSDRWNTPPTAGFNFQPTLMVVCKNCKKDVISIIPGKYDRPNAPLNRCSVQHVVTI